ncbi:hypothetical protein BKA70DRAFT_1287748 [Coprinopsis sp. MPI-PUGE-AT-0042]|nr:hypothetical protein BKA70DRAFT_1287748 [Coprinopsis sp. MPI-PUGE-AT-0042]
MHHCLQIDEVLLEIFLHVLLLEHPFASSFPVSSPTVSSLARTCRTFHNPALTVLWREVNGLAQLFSVLPAAKIRWEEVVIPRGGTHLVLHLAHPPTQEEWATFFKYGQMVKHLQMGNTWRSRPGKASALVDVDLETLSAIPHSRTVFPHLQTLVAEWGSRGISLYHLILPETLEEVTIRLHDSAYNPSLHGFLAKLGSRCGRIRSLTLYLYMYEDYKVTVPLEGGIGSISTLTALSAMWFELPPRLFNVSTSSGYGDLQILKIGHTTANIDSWFPPGPLQFPKLTELSILSPIGPDLQVVQNLLSRSQCPSLLDLEVLISGDTPTEQSFRTLFTCIAENCNTSRTLSKMYIIQIYGNNNTNTFGRDDMEMRFETIKPLTCFSRMKAIHIDIPSSFLLDDRDLSNLAKCWVQMVSMKVGTPSPDPIPHAATISSLRYFAALCPDLNTLSIPFEPVFSDEGPWNQPLNSRCSVRTLYVGGSKVRSSAIGKVAAYLSGLFPKLREVHYCPVGEIEDLDRSWKKVNSLLSVFASVRHQERLLAKQRDVDAAEEVADTLAESSDSEDSLGSTAASSICSNSDDSSGED